MQKCLACSRNNKNTSMWPKPNEEHDKEKKLEIKRQAGTLWYLNYLWKNIDTKILQNTEPGVCL